MSSENKLPVYSEEILKLIVFKHVSALFLMLKNY